jgi:hypothetical protein
LVHLDVSGDTGVRGTLNVSGISTFTSNIVVNGTAGVTGALNVSGAGTVFGTLRASSNIVAVQTALVDISTTWVSYTNKLDIVSIAYTPKQTSGNVRLIVEGRSEQGIQTGGSFDEYGYRILNTTVSAELAYFNTCWSSANVGNSGRNVEVENFAHGRAITTVSGGVTNTFVLQLYENSDDTIYYRRPNLTVTELSTI